MKVCEKFPIFTDKLGNMVISVKIVSKSLLKFFFRLINRFIKTSFTNGLCHSVN